MSDDLGVQTLRFVRRAAVVDAVILSAIGVWAGADILYNQWKAKVRS